MARLTTAQLDARLLLDFEVASAMSCPVMGVSAHRSLADARASRQAIRTKSEGNLARFYRVEYRIRTLAGPGKYMPSTTVVFDLLANGNYPLSEPACWVVSRPMPWSPHFKEGAVICISEEFWVDARGEILLGHLLAHIARLLNWDEVARGGGYVGWNGEAIRYWQCELGEKPITPGLKYPVPDPRLTHRLPGRTVTFRSARPAPPAVFRGQCGR